MWVFFYILSICFVFCIKIKQNSHNYLFDLPAIHVMLPYLVTPFEYVSKMLHEIYIFPSIFEARCTRIESTEVHLKELQTIKCRRRSLPIVTKKKKREMLWFVKQRKEPILRQTKCGKQTRMIYYALNRSCINMFRAVSTTLFDKCLHCDCSIISTKLQNIIQITGSNWHPGSQHFINTNCDLNVIAS